MVHLFGAVKSSEAAFLKKGISVVVPVYNSYDSLYTLSSRVSAVMNAIGPTWELILVDDGSRDGSWQRIAEICEKNSSISGVQMMRNYGQHNALLCGIRMAKYSIVVTMDDDLQNPPEEIPKLLNKLVSTKDVVYGVPQKETHGILRDLASLITKLALQRTMGANTARNISAFRAFRTDLRNAFETYQGAFVSIDVLLTWGSSKFDMVQVHQERRLTGTSNYTVGKLLSHAMNMMTGFTTIPLQLASVVGLIFTIFGFFVLCFVVVRYFIDGTNTPGFPFLASLIAIFSGAQLFALGIFGEYLARIHSRALDRPSYSVRTTTDV